jgi:hypothetical protein
VARASGITRGSTLLFARSPTSFFLMLAFSCLSSFVSLLMRLRVRLRVPSKVRRVLQRTQTYTLSFNIGPSRPFDVLRRLFVPSTLTEQLYPATRSVEQCEHTGVAPSSTTILFLVFMSCTRRMYERASPGSMKVVSLAISAKCCIVAKLASDAFFILRGELRSKALGTHNTKEPGNQKVSWQRGGC